MSLYCKQNEITIKEFVKNNTFPVIVKTCLNKEGKKVAFQNVRAENENETVLLQRIVRVKYASVRILKFHDNDEKLNSNDRACIENCDEFTGKQFLIPVKYKGHVKFVHRPGCRRRYISVSQVLEDPPRYITLWDETPALQCNAEGDYVTVPAESHLEVIRKVKSSQTKSTYLECSNGESLFAFGEHDRLNCTAVDDTKNYNLYELVRTNILPRVVQFDSVDPADISNVDERLNKAALSLIARPLELQGFVDRELIVSLIRNEQKQRYETVLIPQNLWSTLTLEREKETNEEKQNDIAQFNGSFDNVDLVEKSLYLMSLNQRKVVRLMRSDCKDEDFHNSDSEYVEIQDDQYPGPVVLLPQVKKKQSLFKKVHAELLRWFTTNDKEPIEKSTQQRKHAQRKATSTSSRKAKQPAKRISRSISFSDVRCQNKTTVYRRKMYGDMSYIEFSNNNDSSVTQTFTKCMNNRLSRSLNDIVFTENPQSMKSRNKTHPQRNLSIESNTSNTYSEIGNEPESYARNSHNNFSGDNIGAYTEGACKQVCVQEQEQSLQNPTQTSSMRHVSIQKSESHNLVDDNIDSSEFYSYTCVETVQCLINCGLHDFAEQCKTHKLDGPFFRNLDLDVLKDEPFHLSSFHLIKLKKIIFDGWRPS